MSHVALIITSERCGHCRNMRGNGRLLSQTEIKRDKKQPTIPGGYHYDSKFMKKVMTAGLDGPAKLRVVNVHLNTMNPAEGVKDISVMTLMQDGNTIEQSMVVNEENKVRVTVYNVDEVGKVKSNEILDIKWEEVAKKYVPVNLSGYCAFYPGIVLFEGNAWMQGLQNGTPIYGYYNGFETKDASPYGINPQKRSQPIGFIEFLMPFFNGTKELLGSPKVVETKNVVVEEKNDIVMVPSAAAKKESENVMIPSAGARDKLKFRLYVVETKN